MGTTYTTVEITNLENIGKPYINQFLVDTGAINCLMPSSALHAAGIKELRQESYELADGSLIKCSVGYAIVRFMGAETVTQVIFGPEDCEPLLGVVALENTGFGVDPITKTLKKFHAIALK